MSDVRTEVQDQIIDNEVRFDLADCLVITTVT